jgi:hypothetical protein
MLTAARITAIALLRRRLAFHRWSPASLAGSSHSRKPQEVRL